MGSILAVAFGIASYVLFFGTFVYAIGFVGNVLVPKSIDSGTVEALGSSIAVNLALLAVFAVQHSVMARRGFKAWWTRIVPAAVERSTYVLAATMALALLMWQWRAIPEPVVWDLTGSPGADAVQVAFWAGWALLLTSTFLIDHFELFGLRQVFARMSGRAVSEAQFRAPVVYRYVRHPIYLGFMIGFWAAPVMTAGHLLFALGATGYILVGIWFEERDLIRQFGATYEAYRRQVGMLLPSRRADSAAEAPGYEAVKARR